MKNINVMILSIEYFYRPTKHHTTYQCLFLAKRFRNALDARERVHRRPNRNRKLEMSTLYSASKSEVAGTSVFTIACPKQKQ